MRWIRGESIQQLAEDYKITIEQVQKAIDLAHSYFDFYKGNSK